MKKSIKQGASPGQTVNSQPSTTGMSLDQIEERLLKNVLSGTLALHILRNTRKPTRSLVKELMDLEVEVGHFVGTAMQMHVESLKAMDLHGVLAGALSFIPMGAANTPKGPLPLSEVKKRVPLKAKQKCSHGGEKQRHGKPI